jgi:hypothetical protein
VAAIIGEHTTQRAPPGRSRSRIRANNCFFFFFFFWRLAFVVKSLDEELLDRGLERVDLRLELRALLHRDRRGNHRPRHAARAPEGDLGLDKAVDHVLVLGQERDWRMNE